VGGKRNPEPVVRTAEQPGQAINVDLCFVPEQHIAEEKLPAVSGSSGHLVVERIHPIDEEPHWPGQIFAKEELDFAEAMRQYAQATQGRLIPAISERIPILQGETRWRKEWEGRAKRYQTREQRKQEKLTWQTAKAEWRQTRHTYQKMGVPERKERRVAYQMAYQTWIKVRKQHQETLRKWQEEDQVWHQYNQKLKVDSAEEVQERSWIAILIATDNCTRQSLGLPIFRTGAKVTSAEVAAALKAILPNELQFMISDQGTHFRSKIIANLAKDANFIHVPIYRHRPESNGIAERFVLTLKDWLRSRSWESPDSLSAFLTEFQREYNDRPHQGLAVPGLSPNEFANRIWLM
jgi:hypothetical protein